MLGKKLFPAPSGEDNHSQRGSMEAESSVACEPSTTAALPEENMLRISIQFAALTASANEFCRFRCSVCVAGKATLHQTRDMSHEKQISDIGCRD